MVKYYNNQIVLQNIIFLLFIIKDIYFKTFKNIHICFIYKNKHNKKYCIYIITNNYFIDIFINNIYSEIVFYAYLNYYFLVKLNGLIIENINIFNTYFETKTKSFIFILDQIFP